MSSLECSADDAAGRVPSVDRQPLFQDSQNVSTVIFQAEGTKIKKFPNTSTSFRRIETMFVDGKALMPYAGPFSLLQKISFLMYKSRISLRKRCPPSSLICEAAHSTFVMRGF